MVDTKEYSKAATEVIEIIKYMSDEAIAKIPPEVIRKLNEKKLDDYYPEIDITKPLEENNLTRFTIVILVLLYKDYLADENEKKELEAILNKNVNDKYGNDIFKEHNEQSEMTDLIPAETKQSVLKKIFGRFFK